MTMSYTRFTLGTLQYGQLLGAPIWNSIHDHLTLPVTTNPLPSLVSDLWIPDTQTWDIDLLANTFDNQAV